MRSSTNIEIKCPLLTDGQLNELLDLLEGLDDEWLKKEYWQVSNQYGSCSIRVEENGVGYDVAEMVGDVVFNHFLSKYFKGRESYVKVRYSQMNADGTYGWNLYCDSEGVLYEDSQEIYCDYVNCDKCCKNFEIKFDYDEDSDYYDDEYDDDEDEEEKPEEKIVCPHCGKEYIRKGNWLISREKKTWEQVNSKE